MANIQDTITRLPVHARHIGVGAVGAGAHRVCAHTRRSNVGGGGKDSVKITEIGNMALFCLFNIRGNNVLECGDDEEHSAARRISAH